MRLFLASVFLLGVAAGQSPVYFSVPGPDAPELAKRGAFAVGVRTVDLVHRGQVDILKFDKTTGKAPLYDRPLKIEVWYPAVIPAGKEEKTTYVSAMFGTQNTGGTFDILGKALRDAPPVTGQKFPLVVVSHGYPGSRTFLTYLTENLASKGYVVAAIDHTDSVFGEVRPFPSTLLNRSNDQLFTIESIGALSSDKTSFLNGLADAGNAAIVGYSMGGYGALASAGAGYSKTSTLSAAVPGGYIGDWFADSPKFQAIRRDHIKAVVAIAPWGEQPPYNAWDEKGLAGIRIPSLFIAGDHDDVAVYETGIKRAFERAVNSDRCMLVYEGARHNTGGNPPPSGLTDLRLVQGFDEPVWRKDRITAVNQHFISAFLDLNLKQDQTKRDYIRVVPVRSGDGVWNLPPGTQDTGGYSSGKDAAGNAFWKGFQRRWALGMEMSCRPTNPVAASAP
jgi:predicted dienelactone hydrolase